MRTDESLVRTYERKPAQHHCQEQLHYMLDAQQPQLQVVTGTTTISSLLSCWCCCQPGKRFAWFLTDERGQGRRNNVSWQLVERPAGPHIVAGCNRFNGDLCRLPRTTTLFGKIVACCMGRTRASSAVNTFHLVCFKHTESFLCARNRDNNFQASWIFTPPVQLLFSNLLP